MGEQLRHGPEHNKDNLDLSVEIEKNLKRAEKEAAESETDLPQTGEIQKHVEQQAVSGKEITVGEKDKPKTPDYGMYKEMKGQAYERSLGKIRHKLKSPERTMSKVMHQKTVDTVSEGLAKTVARPSGILGGGIAALLGSSALLYMAKKYGFEYNPFTIFALLAAGFLIGVTAELLLKTLLRKRS